MDGSTKAERSQQEICDEYAALLERQAEIHKEVMASSWFCELDRKDRREFNKVRRTKGKHHQAALDWCDDNMPDVVVLGGGT